MSDIEQKVSHISAGEVEMSEREQKVSYISAGEAKVSQREQKVSQNHERAVVMPFAAVYTIALHKTVLL